MTKCKIINRYKAYKKLNEVCNKNNNNNVKRYVIQYHRRIILHFGSHLTSTFLYHSAVST